MGPTVATVRAAITTPRRGFRLDPTMMLLAPATVFLVAVFVYPFAYGFLLSFQPHEGMWISNYTAFFSSERLWHTLPTTMKLAIPATLVNLGLALPLAYRLRVKSWYQKSVT